METKDITKYLTNGVNDIMHKEIKVVLFKVNVGVCSDVDEYDGVLKCVGFYPHESIRNKFFLNEKYELAYFDLNEGGVEMGETCWWDPDWLDQKDIDNKNKIKRFNLIDFIIPAYLSNINMVMCPK